MTPLRREQWLAGTLALLATSSVAAVVATSSGITTSEQRARPGNLFSAFYEAEISRIQIERSGVGSVVLERRSAPRRTGEDDARPWRIGSPVNEETDVAAVKQLLATLRDATWVRRASDDASRSALGLDEPSARMKVEMLTATYQLTVGKESPQPAGSRYVEIAGEGVPNPGIVVVAGSFVDAAFVSADALRVRKLVSYSAVDLARVEMSGTGGERRMVQRSDRAWYFDGQLRGARLERDAMERIFIQLDRARAERFVDVEQAEQGLAASGDRVQLILTPKDSAQPAARLDIGGRCTGVDTEAGVVAVRRAPDPMAACVPSSVMVGLTVDAEALVSRHVVRLRADEVEEIHLDVPDASVPEGVRRLELARSEGGYRLRAPSEGDVSSEAGDERIRSVVDLRGEPTVRDVTGEPLAATLTVRPSGDSPPEVVEVRGRDDALWAVRRADSVVLQLPPDARRVFRVDGTLLRSLDVLSFDKSRLREVRTRGAVEQVLRFEAGGGATLVAPTGFEADPMTTTTMAHTLASLTARRWVAGGREPSMSLERPTLTVRLSVAEAGSDAARSHTLVVGARTSGGHFAALDEDSAVFVLDERAVHALSAWAIRRSVFDVHWDEVRSLTLAANSGEIALRRIGSGMVASSSLGVSIEELERSIRDLVPERVVHPGPAKPHEGFDAPVLTLRSEGAWPVRYVIGARDVHLDTLGYYARADGTDATYFVPEARVRALLSAF